MRILVAVTLVFFVLTSYAQVTEGTNVMSQGHNNCLTISLKGTDSKTVDAAWSKYLKDYKGKTKMNKKAAEMFSDNANIEGMSANSVDIYSKTVETAGNVALSVWFDLGGAYVASESHPEAYTIGEKMLTDFSQTVSTAAILDQIKMEEDVMGKMENEMKSLAKDKSNLEDEIKKCEEKITEAKAKIVENETAQMEQQKVIDAQQAKIKTVKGKLKSVN